MYRSVWKWNIVTFEKIKTLKEYNRNTYKRFMRKKESEGFDGCVTTFTRALLETLVLSTSTVKKWIKMYIIYNVQIFLYNYVYINNMQADKCTHYLKIGARSRWIVQSTDTLKNTQSNVKLADDYWLQLLKQFKLYSSTSTRWWRRGLKRVPRCDID